MFAPNFKKIALLLTFFGFTACTSYKTLDQSEENERAQLSSSNTEQIETNEKTKLEELHNSDSVSLIKFNYQIESENFEGAKTHANNLSSPEGRAIAFLKIALGGKSILESSSCEEKSLKEAITNLSLVSDVLRKFTLQQEFLNVLLRIDPRHKQKLIQENFIELLDNFWKTSVEMESKSMKLTPHSIDTLNSTFNKSWLIESSSLKKSGLEGKIYVAKLRYPLNPEKSHSELAVVKDQVWEISSPSAQLPFIVDLIDFELDVTKNLQEARSLVRTLKKTLVMASVEKFENPHEASGTFN